VAEGKGNKRVAELKHSLASVIQIRKHEKQCTRKPLQEVNPKYLEIPAGELVQQC
jgi:hypothetical protein